MSDTPSTKFLKSVVSGDPSFHIGLIPGGLNVYTWTLPGEGIVEALAESLLEARVQTYSWAEFPLDPAEIEFIAETMPTISKDPASFSFFK